MSERHVACAGDLAYLPHLATMLRSLLDRGGDPAGLNVHVMHPPGWRARRAFARLERLTGPAGATLHRHAIPAHRVAGLPTLSLIPAVMWYRVLLPELLGGVERVLYLDSDLLVLDDLGPLHELGLGGAALGAVTNALPPHLRGHPASLGLDPRDYFNSGVLVLDLERLRAGGATADILSIARAPRRSLLLPDQDALNLVLAHRRATLAPRWNATSAVVAHEWGEELFTAEELAAARANPAIRHFEGPGAAKPWDPGFAGAEAALWRSFSA